MPLDPNIPLRQQPLDLAGIALNIFKAKELSAQSARQERELKIREQKAKLEQRETLRKNVLRDTSGLIERLNPIRYDDEAVRKTLFDELTKVGKDSPNAGAIVDMINLHRQDPQQAFQVFDQKVQQARSEKLIPELEKGEQINVLVPGKEGIQPGIENPQGQIVDPKTRKLIPGAIKAPSRQITGTPEQFDPTKSQKGKLLIENIAAEQNVRKNIAGMENVIGLVTSDDFIGGTAGDATAFINSGIAQLRQATGTDSVIKDGKLDESLLEVSPENMNRFRRAAITNDRVEAATLDLAYTLARQRDPGGRLSDADVKLAEKTIKAGADKASIVNLLRDQQKKLVRDFNSDQKVLRRRFPGVEFPMFEEETKYLPLADSTKTTSKEAAERILRDAGLLGK